MSFDDWEEVRLGDVLNFRRGHDLSKSNMNVGTVPVVGSNGIIGTHDSYTTKSPCLTIGRSGNVGTPWFYNENCWAHNTTLYVDNFKGNSPKYLYYLLETLNLRNYGGGSAVPTLNRNHIHPLLVKVTNSLQEQTAIARTLSCLDDKIELNNRMNKTLEEMAQTLFKNWFVDFEPFKDGEFEESEMGLIPKGWRVGTIGEYVKEMRNGATPRRNIDEYWNSNDVPWIKTGEIKNQPIVACEEYISIKGLNNSSTKQLPPFTVLLAMYGATAGKVGLLGIEATTNQACCGMICESKNKAVYLFLYLLINQDYIASLSSGSAQQNLSKNTISNIKLIIPENIAFDKISFELIYFKYMSNIKQAQTLTKLRDTLLPKLMSGEIRVPISKEV